MGQGGHTGYGWLWQGGAGEWGGVDTLGMGGFGRVELVSGAG